MKILWLARQIPFPLTSGDRIYTAGLVESIARAGCEIVYLGLEAPEPPLASSPRIDWRPLSGGMGPQFPFLLSASLPMVAVRHRTSEYRQALARLLAEQSFDVIVLDQYGMVWCLDDIAASGFAGMLVHVSHDFETKVVRDIARAYRGNPLKKILLADNARRTAIAERRLARRCDLVTAITDEDKAEFQRIGNAKAYVTLTPGYQGTRCEQRSVDETLPLRVVMLGSFDWLPKRLNLLKFLEAGDQRFAEAGISLHVIGSASADLLQAVAPYSRSLSMRGFVADPTIELAQARLALVFEETGGGFKLKMLDYIFNRVPLFGLERAITGLPPAVLQHVRTAGSMSELVSSVIEGIHSTVLLDAMQKGAYQAASDAFSWDHTATMFIDGIERARSKRVSASASLTGA